MNGCRGAIAASGAESFLFQPLGSEGPVKMAPVPELLAKKAKRDEAWQAQRQTAALEARKKARAQRREIFKRAEQYVNEYRQQVKASAAAAIISTRTSGSSQCVSQKVETFF